MEALNGKWKLSSGEKLQEYLDALGKLIWDYLLWCYISTRLPSAILRYSNYYAINILIAGFRFRNLVKYFPSDIFLECLFSYFPQVYIFEKNKEHLQICFFKDYIQRRLQIRFTVRFVFFKQ